MHQEVSNVRNFFIVFQREFIETLRSRFFRTTSTVFCLILILALVTSIIIAFTPANTTQPPPDEDAADITEGQSDSTYFYTCTAAFDDLTGQFPLERLAALTPTVQYDRQHYSYGTMLSLFNEGTDLFLVVDSQNSVSLYISPKSNVGNVLVSLQDALDRIVCEQLLAADGLSEAEINTLLGASCDIICTKISANELSGDNTEPNSSLAALFISSSYAAQITIFLMSSLLFLSISLYGQMVSMRVMREKSSRMIEVLVTSASPEELLCGKVLGVGAAGLGQVLLFFVLLILCTSSLAEKLSLYFGRGLSFVSELIELIAAVALPALLFLLLGFFQLAFIFGALGAASSDTESVSGLAALPLRIPSLGYILAMFAPMLTGTEFLTVVSLLPMLSPFVMPVRLCVESVPTWELVLSIAFQVASIVASAALSARLYRDWMLRFNERPPRVRELLRTLMGRRA